MHLPPRAAALRLGGDIAESAGGRDSPVGPSVAHLILALAMKTERTVSWLTEALGGPAGDVHP